MKNGLGHYFVKKRLPEVENVASGRRLLAFYLRLCSMTGLRPPW
jgi:hypothetical protein